VRSAPAGSARGEAGGAVIELALGEGKQLTIRLAAGQALDVVGLLREFGGGPK
jgi:hypothetical protein